jgi:NAD(P)-dependent dehydrogenase (short-subunit alcohol dehydrogenase family)
VVGLTEALALYCHGFGIGVSLLCPGGVNTHLAETGRSIGMTPERERLETRMAQTVQGGSELDPSEVGERVAQAVEDEIYLILTDEINAETVRRRGADLNAFLRARIEAQR